ncbi:MAG: AsmA family protein [Candidatus Omnitrophica bacterium]|nr:AsmA family protein [Candidatus Omnitrophota bacterium]MDD5573612.1 AsmA family protein [Candidatus Omnitrophota bacterium]
MKIFKFFIIALGIIFFLIVLLSAATFVVAAHLKLKDLVEREIEQQLGIEVAIQKLEHSPFLTHIFAKGITIDNPAGFDEKELAYINAIHIVWDPGNLVFLKKPNIYLLAIDLERLSIIKNHEGKVNIKELVPIKDPDLAAKDTTPFFFDVFVLSIGTVHYTEYAPSGKKIHIYTIGIKDQAFVRLQDENEVVKLIIYKAIQNTEIGKLIHLTLSPALSGVSDTVDAAWGTAKSGLKSAVQVASLPFKVFFGE